MAYLPRYRIICNDSYFHVTWRCHNKKFLLKFDWAKAVYYGLLDKHKDKYGVDINAYNLMDNHPHLIGHLCDKERFSAFFRVVNSQFARIVNKRLKRCGQVVMDRFKSPRIESDEHMLKAMAYVDLNQHRVKKVSHPKDNEWSSYAYYAHGKPDPLVTPSPSYLALGNTDEERQAEYRAIVASLMASRAAMNISHVGFIGNPDWVIRQYRELCASLGRNMTDAMAARISRLAG